MTEMERLAWAAGFWEGEGSVGFYPPKFARFVASQVHRQPLERFREVMGFGVITQERRAKGNWQAIWRYTVQNRPQVEMAVTRLWPWLSDRRRAQVQAYRAAAAIAWTGGPGSHDRAVTECPQGHPYDATNTLIVKATGHRQCRECGRKRSLAYQRHKRAGL